LPGVSPYESFADPLVRALMPDGAADAWLVTMSGSPVYNGDPGWMSGSGSAPTYPSLWHAQFAPWPSGKRSIDRVGA
jgi:hypothetical protein